jgi:hypothetical protein
LEAWRKEVKRRMAVASRLTMRGDVSNREFAEKDEVFKAACEKVGVKATRRQASKWRMGRGRAWREGR